MWRNLKKPNSQPITRKNIMSNNTAETEKSIAQKFTTANPVEFYFYNQDDERVIFITDDESQLKKQTLTLELRNRSPHEIEFKMPSSENDEITWDQWLASKDLYHFQLSFRPGVLSEKTKACLKDPVYRLATLAKGWDIKYDPNATDLTDWISLLWVGEKHGKAFAEVLKDNPVADPPAAPHGAAAGIPKQATVKLELPKLSAGAGGGTRGTRIHLNYRHLAYKDRKESVPEATRSQFLNIVNHQGKQYLPLHVGFVGSNSILNDGETPNELSLRITNISNSETVSFQKNPASKFTVSFDLEKDHEKKEWALTKISEAAGIHIDWEDGKSAKVTACPSKVIGTAYQNKFETTDFYLHGQLETELSEDAMLMIVKREGKRILRSSFGVVKSAKNYGNQYVHINLKHPITVDKGDSVELVSPVIPANAHWKPEISLQGERVGSSFTYMGKTDYSLGPGESISLKLSQMLSSSPTGYANLYLHYEDIPGYRDGHYTCLIEKTPLVCRHRPPDGHGDVGIGTDMGLDLYGGKPTPKLHVDVSTDNKTRAAAKKKQKPAAVFEGGNVGIGTKHPKSKLAVTDGLTIGAGWVETDAAPSNGLLVEGKVAIGIKQPNGKAALHVNGRIWDKTGYVMPVGTVVAYAGSKAPEGWSMCCGQKVSHLKYAELAKVLGYGAGVPFNIPNYQQRFVVGASGTSEYKLHKKGGADKVSLTEKQMPSHSHSGKTATDGAHLHTDQPVATADNDGWDGWGQYIGNRGNYNKNVTGPGVISSHGSNHYHWFTTNKTGGVNSHENRPPYVALNYIIKY